MIVSVTKIYLCPVALLLDKKNKLAVVESYSITPRLYLRLAFCLFVFSDFLYDCSMTYRLCEGIVPILFVQKDSNVFGNPQSVT